MSEITDDVAEVSYKDSATELFLAIQGMEWRDAFDIIASDPKQVRTWVNNNSGAESTTFNSWRRLPLHEACMRRAPAWLVSELLSAFPESSSLTTNSLEYPLHLAVDKGCAPEVVNLIIVANWNVIVAQDHAGRTPLDIIDHAELLKIEGNQVIFESLKRCHKTYMEIQKAARIDIAMLIRNQKAKSNVISIRHKEKLTKEHAKQVKLEEEIETLKTEINSVKELAQNKEREIGKHMFARDELLETIEDLEARDDDHQRQLKTEQAHVKVILHKIKQKEGEIHRKNTKIDILSKDLQSIVVSNESDIIESLMETEQSMRTMVSAQIALQKMLRSKSTGLKTVLEQRGISVPDMQKRQAPEEQPREEIEKEDDHDNAMQQAAANAAMMAAAMAALQPVA